MGDTVSVGARLAGVRVVTTRGSSGEDRLRSLLEAAGADVLSWPTCEYPPPRDPRPGGDPAAPRAVDRSIGWCLRAHRAVEADRNARGKGPPGPPRPPPHPRVAVVGPANRAARPRKAWTVAVEGAGRVRAAWPPGGRAFPVRARAAAVPPALGGVSTVGDEFTRRWGVPAHPGGSLPHGVSAAAGARVRAGPGRRGGRGTWASPAGWNGRPRPGRSGGRRAAGGMNTCGLAGREASRRRKATGP